MDSIVKPIYGLAGTASIYTIHAHQLSVFFAMLAAGELPDEESVQPTPLARHYYMLSRAAFSLQAITREVILPTVQAILLNLWYMRLSDPKSHEELWLLGGLCVKIAQTVSRYYPNAQLLKTADIFPSLDFVRIRMFIDRRILLTDVCCEDRDRAAWTCDEDEVDRRRLLFWELYTFEAWQSIISGRPASMCIRDTDCHLPRDREPFLNSSGNLEASCK